MMKRKHYRLQILHRLILLQLQQQIHASLINKTAIINGNKIYCTYYATSQSPQWLQVIYKGDIIFRYKLNIEKEPFNFPPIKIKDIVAKN